MLALTLDGRVPRLDRGYPEPTRGHGEALVRMRLAGICDTDLQLARGYLDFRGVPGHEFVGQVLDADDPRWLGARVVADINAGCGQCPDCMERDGHHCTRRSVLGILGRNGAFAELLTVPERCLVRVPEGVSDEQAVFSEPLAAALHVLDAIPPAARGSARVAVIGDGKLGLLIALALASTGLSVTAIGHHREKLGLLPEHIQAVLESQLAGQKFQLVVEATGTACGLERALTLTEPRGTIVLKTTVHGHYSIDLAPIVINELSIVGSRCGAPARAMALLANAELDPTPLIGRRYPLSHALEAFASASAPGMLKVLVEGCPAP